MLGSMPMLLLLVSLLWTLLVPACVGFGSFDPGFNDFAICFDLGDDFVRTMERGADLDCLAPPLGDRGDRGDLGDLGVLLFFFCSLPTANCVFGEGERAVGDNDELSCS